MLFSPSFEFSPFSLFIHSTRAFSLSLSLSLNFFLIPLFSLSLSLFKNKKTQQGPANKVTRYFVLNNTQITRACTSDGAAGHEAAIGVGGRGRGRACAPLDFALELTESPGSDRLFARDPLFAAARELKRGLLMPESVEERLAGESERMLGAEVKATFDLRVCVQVRKRFFSPSSFSLAVHFHPLFWRERERVEREERLGKSLGKRTRNSPSLVNPPLATKQTKTAPQPQGHGKVLRERGRAGRHPAAVVAPFRAAPPRAG